MYELETNVSFPVQKENGQASSEKGVKSSKIPLPCTSLVPIPLPESTLPYPFQDGQTVFVSGEGSTSYSKPPQSIPTHEPPQNTNLAPEPLPVAPVTTVSAVNPPLLQGGIPLGTNASDALLLREIEKQRIRQEILAAERWELEIEVRMELAMERGMWIPLLRNPTPQVFVLDKKDPQVCGDKRKAETADVSAPSGPNKILKQVGFSCALCQVSATSEKGLQDHLRGKKHRKKEAALKRQQIGLLDEEAV